ncbi:unnamed protein product, partial [Sphagnum compactum]
ILLYDTKDFSLISRQDGLSDCVNSVQFNPQNNKFFGLCTGQRHFSCPMQYYDSDDSDIDSKEEKSYWSD